MRELTEAECYEIALIENIQRQDLCSAHVQEMMVPMVLPEALVHPAHLAPTERQALMAPTERQALMALTAQIQTRQYRSN